MPHVTVLRCGLVLDGEPATSARRDIVVIDGHVADPHDVAALTTDAFDEVVDLEGKLVIPGLVNAHHHSNEAWLRGRFDRLPLEPWMLFTYPPLREPRETPHEVYVRTALSAMELVRTGATSVVDFLFEPGGATTEALDAVVSAYRDVGLRAVVALGMADVPWHETVEAEWDLVPKPVLAELHGTAATTWPVWEEFAREAVARHHRPADGVAIALGPSGPQRCSEEMLGGCAALAAELDLGIHIHVLETRMQVATGLRRIGTTLPKNLESLEFLSDRVTFEHGIWLEDDDIERLARHEVAVSHNPASNLKLGSGICPVPRLFSAGLDVALGTDGPSSNDGSDMLATLKLAALLHRGPDLPVEEWLGAPQAWRMATRAGSRVVGERTLLGHLGPGAHADLVALDLHDPAFTPLGDPLLHLAYGAPARAICDVMVGGRWILREHKLQGVDEASLLAEARDLSAHVHRRRENVDALGQVLTDAVFAGWRRLQAGGEMVAK